MRRAAEFAEAARRRVSSSVKTAGISVHVGRQRTPSPPYWFLHLEDRWTLCVRVRLPLFSSRFISQHFDRRRHVVTLSEVTRVYRCDH